MKYLDIANSSFIFQIGAVVIGFVLFQSVFFLIRAWREGLNIGLTREQMMAAVKSSAIFTIVPSLPILISLIAMAPVLGLAFPWIRLSVIGSAPYELMAAEIGAQSMGVDGLGGTGFAAEVFSNSVWVMTLGMIWSLLICIFFLRTLEGRVKQARKKDSTWMTVMITALYFGMLTVFIGQPIVAGGVALATTASSAAIMLFITWVMHRFKQKWLGNFAMAVSMVGAMALAILFTNTF